MSKEKKKLYEVQKHETIDQCLDRIQVEGFIPVKRTEKPIFMEVNKNGIISHEPIGRKIIFEAKLKTE